MNAHGDEARLEAAGWKPDRFGADRTIWKQGDLALEKTQDRWTAWDMEGFPAWVGETLTEEILSRPRAVPEPEAQEPEM